MIGSYDPIKIHTREKFIESYDSVMSKIERPIHQATIFFFFEGNQATVKLRETKRNEGP